MPRAFAVRTSVPNCSSLRVRTSRHLSGMFFARAEPEELHLAEWGISIVQFADQDLRHGIDIDHPLTFPSFCSVLITEKRAVRLRVHS
jgi:hypothetical protein